jgi:hypothetical protein
MQRLELFAAEFGPQHASPTRIQVVYTNLYYYIYNITTELSSSVPLDRAMELAHQVASRCGWRILAFRTLANAAALNRADALDPGVPVRLVEEHERLPPGHHLCVPIFEKFREHWKIQGTFENGGGKTRKATAAFESPQLKISGDN